MAKSAQQMIDKYKAGISGGGAAYQAGVNGTTKDPIQAAIKAKDKWAQKIQEAINNDSFAAGLQGVTKAQWQQSCVAATSKYTGSAPQATAKFTKYAQIVAPLQAANSAAIDAMPNTTDADSEARMMANLAFQRNLKGIMRGRR